VKTFYFLIFFALALCSCSETKTETQQSRSYILGTEISRYPADLIEKSKSGDSVSQRKLGLLAIKPPLYNPELALEWFVSAADQGDAIAQYNLFSMLYGTIHTPLIEQDQVKAVWWLNEAAKQGLADALYAAYIHYWIEKNETIAKHWWVQLLALGDEMPADIMIMVGGNFLTGMMGVDTDYTEGLNWTLRAAQKGNCDAMQRIAMLEHKTKDPVKALAWIELALESVSELTLPQEARSLQKAIVAGMTAKQMTEAEELKIKIKKKIAL
jgi:TPR repeat protein